ncbi:MAG: NUDIX hydrolase [Chloroflexi bacterium]|nr:NUDIX hydrolase [Chloroflexota bacterium]MDA8187112.1 NUDIX hydrolase [Dehalococcoidales bacterium]
MYVDGEIIKEAEARFGIPKDISLQFEIDDRELAIVRGSRKNQRSHDITMFIFLDGRGNGNVRTKDARLAVIRKRSFPPGAYRAPSGGLKPGEPLEAGAMREAHEETGLEVELERYLVRIHATFTHGNEIEKWVSHVFSARVVGGDLEPIDTDEIEGATFVNLRELQGPIRDILLGSKRGLLAYRVALTDFTVKTLVENGDIDLGD